MKQPLIVFMIVAEKKSFTRAAEELHMTQPAVSQYIQILERSLGTALLDRSTKYVRLNKAGEIVYYHAKEIIGLYTRMQCLVDELIHRASGDLFIGASYTFGEYLLPHMIAYLLKQYPFIKPSIRISNTKEIVELVLNHQIDVGIVEGECIHEKLHVECFAEDCMYVVGAANHPLLQQKDVTASELAEQTWIVRELGSGTREATEKMFVGLQIAPRHVMEFGSTQIVKESVEVGIGISLLSQWAIRKELALGSMKIITVSGLPVFREFSLATKITPFHTKATEIFVDMLREKKGIPGIIASVGSPL